MSIKERNKWTALKPISTAGKINADHSRLVIYEKSSLTTSQGGYRLMSKILNNTTRTDGKEADGYVVFDLFVKNLSGEAYYPTQNVDNEEAIYLTPESQVTVGTSGTKDTGIENSVRVAFAQIGRVESDKDASVVTGITCATAGDVTGICAAKDAQIWEPNDTAHVANAISWYNTSCEKRTGDDVTESDSYSGACEAIVNGTHYPTYVVSAEIDEEDNVDVYDGLKYNTYEATKTAGLLTDVDTLTDTEKMYTGTARPTFMTLAPNSITKIRVYVYIEGQDVDNYDFAQLGKSIQVNFGFTKERYTTDDYDDEPVTIIPGAENTQIVDYPATGEVTEVTNALWDATSKKFTTLKSYNAFEFKEGEQKMKATYLPETGWQFAQDNS